jgi:uncharacterized protein YdeI (YjbR/CyaY-like superfamily)
VARVGKGALTFRSPAELCAWFDVNHATVPVIELRCFKAGSEKQGVTYRQALDEALCFGWIDGVRHSLDASSFLVRFTPRKPKSLWSKVNVKRAKELQAAGRMRPPGAAAFAKRVASRYSFESKPVELDPALLKQFRSNPRAWAFWQTRPPGERRLCCFYVMSAKQEATRLRRLGVLVDCLARGQTLPGLARSRKK